jgi:hypothetical protein
MVLLMSFKKYEFGLSGGMNTKVAQKDVQPPDAIYIENALFDTVGLISKRSGFSPLGGDPSSLGYDRDRLYLHSPNTVQDVKAIANRNDEILYFDGKWMYSHMDSSSKRWIARDRHVSCIISHESYSNKVSEQTVADYAEDTARGIGVLVYQAEPSAASGATTPIQVFAEVIDTTDNHSVLTIGPLNSDDPDTEDSFNPRVEYVDNSFVVVWVEVNPLVEPPSNIYSLFAIEIESDNIISELFAVPSINGIASSAVNHFDMCSSAVLGKIFIVCTDGPTSDIRLYKIASSATYEDDVTIATTVYTIASPGMSVSCRDVSAESRIVVGYLNSTPEIYTTVFLGSDLSVYRANTQTSTSIPAAHQRMTSEWVSDTSYIVLYDIEETIGFGAYAFQSVYAITCETSSGSIVPQAHDRVVWDASLTSHAFVHGDEIMFSVDNHASFTGDVPGGGSLLQRSRFLYVWTTDTFTGVGTPRPHAVLIGRYLAGSAHRSESVMMPKPKKLTGSNIYKIGEREITRVPAADPINRTAESKVYKEPNAVVVTLDFDSQDNYSYAQIGNSIYLNGGMLYQYDGDMLSESGFLLYPEFAVAAPTAGALSYSYRFYYEFYDANGERSVSSYAGILTVDDAASITPTNDVDFDLFTVNHTRRKFRNSVCNLAGYRSEVDPGPDAIFHRVTSLNPSEVTGDNKYVPSLHGTYLLQFSDGLTDVLLTENEYDYQSSGELDNIAPPSPAIIGASKDRLWLAGGEIAKNRVIYSKKKLPGRAVEFNDSLTIDLDNIGGKITAIHSLNQNVVVFKESKIYVIGGDGPNNLGQGEFYPPAEVASDVGCVNQKTVVETPQGLLFVSSKGIYLLSNDFSVEYIGARMEAYNHQNYVSASIVPGSSIVVFMTDDGYSVVYNYLLNAWCVWSIRGTSCISVSGELYYSDAAGVYKENKDVFVDYDPNTGTNVYYKLKIISPWLKIETNQGYFRAKKYSILGVWIWAHTLTAMIEYNYDTRTAFQYSQSFSTDAVPIDYGGTNDPVYQLSGHLPRQKCQSVRFTISDVENEAASPPEGQSYATIPGGEPIIEADGGGWAFNKLQLMVRNKKGDFPVNNGKE